MSNVAFLPIDPSPAERFTEDDVLDHLRAERERIARELHDVVAFSLSTIIVQAGVAGRSIQDRPHQVAESLQAIKTASQAALHEFRTILGSLRDAEAQAEPQPGLARLDALAESVTDAGVPTRVIVRGEARSLPVEVDRAAYRIVQEALTNVVRHAHGATAWVVVSYEPRSLEVMVENDGAPHAPAFCDGSGNGIRGMRERAELLGGELRADRQRRGGFRVTATLPTSIRR